MSLKNDCFAHPGTLTPYSEAAALLADRITCQVGVESVPIGEALGRILAEDIQSPRDVPPHDNAAVDGYAVYFDDLDPVAEVRLPVTGRIAAGHPLNRPAKRGEALRIFTGAVMPDGPDTVFMEEDVTEADGVAVLPPGLKQGANRRKRGEDIHAGDAILNRGKILRPQDLGYAASVGVDRLPVYEPVRVAIFSTGDEVRDPSGDAPTGCIFDANRYQLMGFLKAIGAQVTDLGILPDREEAIRDALAGAARDHHVLLTSGGVSLGEEDHIKPALEAAGGALHFWRLAIKPGRPIALGTIGNAAFIGLPGNPVATAVTFMMVARPVIRAINGATPVPISRYPVRAGEPLKKKPGRLEWQRVCLRAGADGEPRIFSAGSSGAGILTTVVAADGLAELDTDRGAVATDEWVSFIPFSEVLG